MKTKSDCLAAALSLFLIVSMSYGQEIPHKEMERPCDQCHSTREWNAIQFDHTKTPFPLKGGHRQIDCIHCHDLQDFTLARPDCRSCHLDVHQGRLPYACERCHDENGWTVLDIYRLHANTSFPILGSHAKVDCFACHRGEITGEFTRLQSDCYACHEQDYRSVKNPAHLELGFSRRCEECHSFIAWTPANFGDHDRYFPISSGTHAGVWESCLTCHTSPANYKSFSCINCHEHSAGNTIDEHDEVRGFTYEPTSCYRCHPRGREE